MTKVDDKCLICGGEEFEISNTADNIEEKFCINCGYRLGTTPEQEAIESFEDDLYSGDKPKH
jgi:hypothetical protein